MMEQAGQAGSIEAAMRLNVYSVFTLMKVARTLTFHQLHN